MPEAIVSRILRLPGYGAYAWEADEVTGVLWLSIRQTTATPYYVCGGCGISVRDVHSWTERKLRDLPWGRLARVAAGRGASGAVSALRGAHRTVALCDGQGALHDAAGGGRGPRL